MCGWVDRWIGGGCVEGWMCEWVDGWMCGWMVAWMYGWMEGKIKPVTDEPRSCAMTDYSAGFIFWRVTLH